MPEELPLTATINGDPFQQTVPVHETLLELLRERLDLTGAKASCTLELCGTCTVLLDGQPVSACTLLAAEIDGREVLTIEGLADARAGGELHPIQRAFAQHGALQCGFCTPGFVLTAVALLRRDPDPDDETIRRELHGNICRCTGYEPIIAAIREASDELKR
ncbi:MAG: (2Fe-2S)-binding protein [Solirubrobacterales bacterium]|nr:(2Fe-2S)-binding protein [Solirubrobacterales bacterium]